MTISIESRFKGYVVAFQIQDQHPDQFVVSSNLKIIRKLKDVEVNLQKKDFKKNIDVDGSALVAPPIVITTLAKEILQVASGRSEYLIKNISRETREELYTILTVHQKKFQVIGINYSSNQTEKESEKLINNSSINEARKLLKECGRISSLNHVKLACSRLVDADASTIDQMQFHLKFHNLQIKILNQLQPLFLQLGIEQKTLQIIFSKKFFKIGNPWYVVPAETRNLRGFLSLGNIDVNEKGSIRQLNTLLEKIAKKIILEVSTHEDPSISFSNICDAMSRYLEADVKKGFIDLCDIEKVNSLVMIYCLGIETTIRRNSINREAFDQLRQTSHEMSEVIKNSPFSYHKKKGLELVSTAEFIENIFSPYVDDQPPIVNRSVEEVSKMVWRTSIFQSIYRTPVIKYLNGKERDETVIEKSRKFLLSARVDFFNDGGYVPRLFSETNFSSIGKESVKDLYRECYENLQKQSDVPLDEKYVSPDDFIIKIDEVIDQFNQIYLMRAGLVGVLGEVILDPVVKQKNNSSRDIVQSKKQKDSIESSLFPRAVDEAVSELVEPVPAPAVVSPFEASLVEKEVKKVATTPTEKIANVAKMHIEYYPRVTRWFHDGEKVLDRDKKYSNLPLEERAFKVFQHAFPRQVDERINTLFTSFSWHTSSGKCTLYTAPATVRFDGVLYNGFVEYAFSQDKKNCFHRYFAEEKKSLAHQLARDSYLNMAPPAIQESNLGAWNMPNSNITILENKEDVTFLDSKTGNSIAIKRKVS